MLTIALIGSVSIMSYQNATQLVKSAERVRQTNNILDALTDVSATLADAESRQWGYILFNDPDELERYNNAIQRFDIIFERLKRPLADTPIQEQRLSALEISIARQLRLFQQAIDLYQGRPTEISATDPLITRTKRNQDEINRLIAAMEATEEDLLQIQVEQAQSNLQFRLLIEPLATLLTFGILLGVYASLYRQLAKRQKAEALHHTLAQEKKMSELKLQLFSMVSHEFRTPLSLILGSAQLLGETLKQQVEPVKLKNLYRIQSSAKMMTQLLSDILTIARADAGKLEFNPEMLEIQTFCLNLIEDFQLFSENKRSIRFTQQGNCTHAYADEKLLYSILSNLLSNAIKYSPADSCIDFILICEPAAIVFQVKDEGIGISADDQSQLYEPFTRGRNARESIGTGLGLAVVKRCLDLHHGEISVDSEVDRGTRFTVRIPQEFG